MQDAATLIPGAEIPAFYTPLAELWLPILIAAVVVFFLSMISWTVMPHHKPDHRAIPDGKEDEIMAAVRRAGIPGGGYMFPYCSGASMKTEEGKRRYNEGPWGRLRVWSKKPSMTASMLGSFVLYLVISTLIAYIGAATLPHTDDFLKVFQVLGAAGILAYGAGQMSHIIWMDRTWTAFFADFIDAIVFGLATAAIFAFLWPSA